jgi:hypothetical protein
MAALPAYMYRNPMDVAIGRERRELGCALCRHVGVTVYRSYCAHERNERQQGFPTIGQHCKHFEGRGDA